MVGPLYDFVANPFGAVRLSFEQAVAASPAVDPVAAFAGKDWGALDLFRDFLLEKGGLSQVPILDASSRQWIQPNSLVRFRGMVQDMLGKELYIGAFQDGSNWRTNKYSDGALFPMPAGCQSAYESNLWERLLLHCVPVPGHNSWAMHSTPPQVFRNVMDNSMYEHGEKRQRDEEIDENNEHGGSPSSKKQKEGEHPCQLNHSSQGSLVQGGFSEPRNGASLSCVIKMYDTPECDLKLNDVFEFIAIYTFDPEVVAYKEDADDLMDDLLDDPLMHLPPSKVPRLHCLICRKLAIQDFVSSPLSVELPSMIKGIRGSLLSHLTQVLGNDGLAGECLLLHLLSRLRARVDAVSVGKLSLNLTGFNGETASIFGNRITSAIQSLLPFSQYIPLTVDYLNTATLQPKKNNQTGRLIPGVLQLAQGTHLTIDESHLQPGNLDSNGVHNARLLKKLIEQLSVEYDFEFYTSEMTADVQLLILSDGKSNIMPADLVLPFCPNAVNSIANPSPEELQSWRWYLDTLRSLPYSSQPDLHQMLQDELVAAMREDRSLGCQQLNRWLTMARLISVSFGEEELSLEHWQMFKEIERLRKERIK
ncbi:Mini-chromosome maintenance complex-binding protein [Dioscorea alata]|uniref:Mini-chromosome maintenance complex-binding protein n=1 Tax=Dioscorea alata TaxID=55571 RepID=A0ACB7VFI9_DIOAL|nr:Mini-chromosome maintenance complex-binding protein [Dioscorea alata]